MWSVEASLICVGQLRRRKILKHDAFSVDTRCIKFCNNPKLLDKFRESAKLLDMVQKGLSDYLETKRAGFSRFYFLSNDELLEILSQTKVQSYIAPLTGRESATIYGPIFGWVVLLRL